ARSTTVQPPTAAPCTAARTGQLQPGDAVPPRPGDGGAAPARSGTGARAVPRQGRRGATGGDQRSPDAGAKPARLDAGAGAGVGRGSRITGFGEQTTMQTIGVATLAESPRDDVIPAMRRYLPEEVRIAERGCLDGLSGAEIAALGPEAGKVGIVARLKSGGSTLLSHAKILPRMQRCVDELIGDEGVDLVVILCG